MAEYLANLENVDEIFDFNGSWNLYEPEYTDEELFETEERTRREREQAEESEPAAAERQRILGDWWCSCGCCDPKPTEDQCLCCREKIIQ